MTLLVEDWKDDLDKQKIEMLRDFLKDSVDESWHTEIDKLCDLALISL